MKVHIVGAGFAGSEAAYFLAESGIEVDLHEMRPTRMTEAHKTDRFAELVCSNSFKSLDPISAPGMMKAEMRIMGSLTLQAAELSKVPAGQALGVDRDVFSGIVTEKIRNHSKIKIHTGEVSAPFTDGLTLFATGPLTAHSLTQWIERATSENELYFYDAIAPIIETSSIDMNHAFVANRYGKGDEDAYLNLPLSKEEYDAFIDAILAGEKVAPKNFEKEKFFQGCQPIEAIAATGRESLRFGPMKPVGLDDPRTGRRPHAVIQLRPENKSKTAYNMVGFQTKLKWGEQSRIFKMIPALRNAEFIRMGSIHRNTYICGPKALRSDLSLRSHPNVYFAGQITGVEGYLESAASGLTAAHFIRDRVLGRAVNPPPLNTALGVLHHYVTASEPKNYQPMNACFAIYDPQYFDGLTSLRKDALRKGMADQALANFRKWWESSSESSLEMNSIENSQDPASSVPEKALSS